MKPLWMSVLLSALIMLTSPFGDAEELSAYLPTPDDLPGWKADGAPQMATGNELFSLIDGAAEVYFEYGFSRALVQSYANDQEQSLQIEIYGMTDPAAAFGIFSFHAGNEGKPIAIGKDGIIGEYYLSFWQGVYFVMLSVSEPEPELLDILKQIAQTMTAKLPAEGERPALATRLFAQQAAPLAVKYIRGTLGLFNLTTFNADVANGFDDGAIVDYEGFEAVLLHYRSDQALAASFEQSRNRFESGAAIRDFIKEAQSFSFINEDGMPIYGIVRQMFFCLTSGKTPQEAEEFCLTLMASEGN